jgi:hypothetical protein
MAAPKRIAFFVFPRLTLLDLIGAYDDASLRCPSIRV